MQNKLVENWLTSSKELSFTAPFAQLLLSEGYTVVQSKGGVVEQGKDIIALDSSGTVHCFQLKCGNIGSKEWQSINGQLNDLTGIAPTHPTIQKIPKSWKCYLVTNGDITGPVLKTITDYSNTNKASRRMPLQTISKDELLLRFATAFGSFFPIEPNDIRIFFELFCEDGDSALKRQEFKQYLEGFLSHFDTIKSKQKKLEAIQATLILASYLLTNKYQKENYLAIIDAWVLTLLTILYYANKWSIDENKYLTSENLILDELDALIALMLNDIASNTNSLIDTTYGVFSEPIITFRLRCADLLGYVSAAINYSVLSKRELPESSNGLIEKITLMNQKKLIISEGGIPGFINSVLASSLNGHGQSAVYELTSLIDSILVTHADDGPGLLSPYYTTEQAVSHMFNPVDTPEESFHNRSYMLWTAVLMLVKYDQREYLNDNWIALSEISMEEIVAHDQNDLLLWRTDNSDMTDTFPNAGQSWGELQKIANRSYDSDISEILLTRKHLIPFMILAMPHRLTPRLILSLTNK